MTSPDGQFVVHRLSHSQTTTSRPSTRPYLVLVPTVITKVTKFKNVIVSRNFIVIFTYINLYKAVSTCFRMDLAVQYLVIYIHL